MKDVLPTERVLLLPVQVHVALDVRQRGTQERIGSGVRRSKLTLPGAVLAGLPAAEVLDGLGR